MNSCLISTIRKKVEKPFLTVEDQYSLLLGQNGSSYSPNFLLILLLDQGQCLCAKGLVTTVVALNNMSGLHVKREEMSSVLGNWTSRWWFQHFFKFLFFTPILAKMIQFDERAYFSGPHLVKKNHHRRYGSFRCHASIKRFRCMALFSWSEVPGGTFLGDFWWEWRIYYGDICSINI